MKKLFKKFGHTISLALVLIMAFALAMLLHSFGAPAVHCVSLALTIVGLYQLSQIAMSKGYSRGRLCVAALTDEQVKEFDNILNSFKGYDGLFKELQDVAKVEGGFAAIKKLPELFKKVGEDLDQQKKELGKLRKQSMLRDGDTGVRYVNGVPFVTDSCALAFAGIYLGCAARQDKWNDKTFGEMEAALTKGAEWLGVTRAALSSADIPLPTLYIPQVVELVYQYGQFRANATIWPMGAPSVNIPQLKVGEDEFAIITASSAVGEKKVAAQNVTFTAQKIGGIVRIPTEIEEDTFIPLGQFLARYIARRFAAFEDKMGFLGDNSATYNRYGVGPYIASQANTPQLQQLAATKTKPTDATINDFRALRTLVNAAVLQRGTAAYYLHPSMEALLVTFNTLNNPLIYQRQNGSQPATLDGFPIRWVGVMQPYSNKAAASTYLAFFGDLSYWYLGERGTPRVETSREVYFATDEIGMRALERIDVQAMAPDAMAALQTAAA